MPDLSVDIIENTIRRHQDLLSLLLIDRTRTSRTKTHHILWATDSYAGHRPTDEITVDAITGKNTYLIQPRIAKTKAEQKNRTHDKAEVFTPKDIVEAMNKQIDWHTTNWPTTEKNWQNYVKENRLEITCGEAPFIVSRYNATNGKKILKLDERVGFLDRKLQTVSKFCPDKATWIKWGAIAFKSSYGYEWQGDNLLLARENLLYTFIDYWNEQFSTDKINLERQVSEDKLNLLKEIATIISWNIFQMDGLKYVVPMSCKSEVTKEVIPPILFISGERVNKKLRLKECPGCAKSDCRLHNGKYVKIMDWEKNKPRKFISLLP